MQCRGLWYKVQMELQPKFFATETSFVLQVCVAKKAHLKHSDALVQWQPSDQGTKLVQHALLVRATSILGA